ncbi:tetraacyldisaccharide 4'-kinase [Sulfurimonas lithotrophica]|uniref:Tetraacyldisaccharide 4'-kinase n=1 Tax=Sulfurimonas lithotrophica TaxID=2590022 RepID=A0A5P8P1H3_9BACT|nr:tetraacyldisaccharide 4'-kinase [Sulfurimonas lithotrophica]QFR49516.1 tetraacyldisaccharide 4'-kinase [Sulfurimonas lithotrophica]
MNNSFIFWVERYFYNPNFFQKIVSFFLLPLSWLYCFFMWLNFKLQKPHDFDVDIISVGNLNVGGSGKTPLVTALASRYENVAVILRGFGRESLGLHVVSDGKKILEDVSVSGDEAMIYANKLPNAIVIVSEDRKEAIDKAKDMGAEIVFLDDAYSKHDIKKLDILIESNFINNYCLPSGPYRERLWKSKEVVLLREEFDFKRKTALKDRCDKMSLITAIARPSRLDKYLPDVVSKNYFADHYNFTKNEIEDILKRDKSDSALVTYKDYVKLEQFNLPLSLLDLEMEVDEKVFKYIEDYRAKKD